MDEKSCEMLFVRYADGDFNAFQMLYDRHKGAVKGFILSLVNDTPLAEDIYQAVWERLIKSSIRLKAAIISSENSFSLKSYLFKIAHNLINDAGRSASREGVYFAVLPQNAPQLDAADESCSSAPDQIALEQLTNCVQRRLSGFKPGFLDAFYLTRDGYLSYFEAAEALAINIETLRSRIKSVLTSIKPCLENHKDG